MSEAEASSSGEQSASTESLLRGLTLAEHTVLETFSQAYRGFAALENSLDCERKDVADAVHTIQRVIAARVARRIDPHVWRQADR